MPTIKTQAIKQYDVNPLPRAQHWGVAGGIILARYHNTSVGPYSELIFSPGLYRLGSHVGFHISQIYVDSQPSLIGGQLNWAVPKKLAKFDWQVHGNMLEVRVSLLDAQQPFLTASFMQSKFHVPASSILVPPPLKTILQLCDSAIASAKYLSTKVSAAGQLHALSKVKVQTDNTVVPDAKDLGIWQRGICLAAFHGSFGKPNAVFVSSGSYQKQH